MASSICICDQCGRIYIKKDKNNAKDGLNYCDICYYKMGMLFKEIVQFINMDKPDKDIYLKRGEPSISFFTDSYISMSLGVDTKAIVTAINEFFDNDGPRIDALKNLVKEIYEINDSIELLVPSKFM